MAADGWQVAGVWAAWLTFAVYVALGIFAFVQVREAKRLREGQALQARELQQAEARPYVVVDFEPQRPPIVNLVIANLGRTMARNVRIEVDPPFDSGVYRSGPVPLAGFKLFTEGIPSLAPGKRIVLLFDSMLERNKLDLPPATGCGSPTSGTAASRSTMSYGSTWTCTCLFGTSSGTRSMS